MTQLNMILMRHGDAEQESFRDFERHLTIAGESQVLLAVRRIRSQLTHINCGLVSDAVRTRETADLVFKSIAVDRICFDSALYVADGVQSLIAIILKHTKAADQTIMLIGHNPVISALASNLSGQTINFSTGEFCLLSHDADQWDLALNSSNCWDIHMLNW